MALIPLSAFFTRGTPATLFVRFAFCKQQALIEQSLGRLGKYFAEGMSGEVLTTAADGRGRAFSLAHGMPPLTLMENAGRAVAGAVARPFCALRGRSAVRPRKQWRRRFCRGADAGRARLYGAAGA